MSELGKSDGACAREARYIAEVTWSSQRWYFCEEHALEERASGDVIRIESVRVRMHDQQLHSDS